VTAEALADGLDAIATRWAHHGPTLPAIGIGLAVPPASPALDPGEKAAKPGRQWSCEATFGADLLPSDLEKDRAGSEIELNAAFRGLFNEKVANLVFWKEVVENVAGRIRRKYEAAGIELPPFNARGFWAQLTPASASVDVEGHLELVRALQTNLQEELCNHIRYRLEHGGNVHFAFAGTTGLGKSSCAISLSNWMKPVLPGELGRRLAFDQSDLIRKLPHLTRGELAVEDELPIGAGQGSKTQANIAENVEDTLRGTGVSIARCTPKRERAESGTTQATFELMGWNPSRQFSVFLAWFANRPHGVVAMPWAPQHVWAEYDPWKKGNLQRTLTAQFRNTRVVSLAAKGLTENQDFVDYMLATTGKPTKEDFKEGVGLFLKENLSTVEMDGCARVLYTWSYGLKRLPRFEGMFGFPPTTGLTKLASRCTSK
jgi:hypothetical protein